MPTRQLPRLYTYAEAEKLLSLSHTTIQRLAQSGTIKRVRMSGTYRLSADSVEEYLRDAFDEDGKEKPKPPRRRRRA